MNLDDPALIPSLDRSDMLAQIQSLPDQLEAAYTLGMALDLPAAPPIRHILALGIGSSAIGSSLLAVHAEPVCAVPFFTQRSYYLPAWADGPNYLVIACSHSGETEETLAAYRCAAERGCTTLAVTTGGALSSLAAQMGKPKWIFSHHGQPRCAMGYTFGLAAAALVRLNLLPDLQPELSETANLMRDLQKSFQPEVPVARNRAKRDAGQLMGRRVAIFGADFLAPVAYRWKTQLNEMAKAWAQAETLPEANHNTLAGLLHPEQALVHTLALFLTAPGIHPRNRLRTELTREVFLQQGIGTDFYQARGQSRLAQMWSCLHYGDYLAYYLALAYGVDPTPVEIIAEFKQALAEN